MLRLLFATLALTGCVSREAAVRIDDGKDPVICLEVQQMNTCRDVTGQFWICDDRGGDHHCMRTAMPAKLFATAPAEAPAK